MSQSHYGEYRDLTLKVNEQIQKSLLRWGNRVPFTHNELAELPDVISAPRFATYLQAMGNHKDKALELYLWNLELSAAFIVPLQVCEVAVRNGVVQALEIVHGQTWPWSNGFIRSLPVPRRSSDYNPQKDLQRTARRLPTAGKIVAELKFAFWEKTFTRGQDSRLWVPHLRTAFPGIPPSVPVDVARANAFAALEAIRKLRNRIAHHEPIFSRNIVDEYARLHDVIAWRSPVAAQWMDKVQSVRGLIPLRPLP